MLHLYTRHLAKCAHSGDAHCRRCHCPKWIRGVLLNGTKIRGNLEWGEPTVQQVLDTALALAVMNNHLRSPTFSSRIGPISTQTGAPMSPPASCMSWCGTR